MNKICLLAALILCTNMIFAQNSGRGFSYQAVARGSDGQVKPSTNIEIRFSLLPGGNAITPDWQETQVATTDEFGVFALTIGKGIKSAGAVAKFSDLNFGIAEYWIKVELKDNGAWQEINKTQLLSVPYAEVAGNAQATPVGTILPFAGTTDKVPSGFMLCDGTSIKKAEYSALFNVIGTAWGTNDENSFNVPDLRGLFLRMQNLGSGRDPDFNSRGSISSGGNTNDAVGSYQSSLLGSHNHGGNTGWNDRDHTHTWGPAESSNTQIYGSGSARSAWSWYGATAKTTSGQNQNHLHGIVSDGGRETRPSNVYVLYIIRY